MARWRRRMRTTSSSTSSRAWPVRNSPARWAGAAQAGNWAANGPTPMHGRSEEHTSELQSLMRISYAVFCLKKKTRHKVKYTISLTTRTYIQKQTEHTQEHTIHSRTHSGTHSSTLNVNKT